MKIPVGDKVVIQVSGWAVVAMALILDNTITNIIRLKALSIISKNQGEKEEEIS